jgi:hypothetical protein
MDSRSLSGGSAARVETDAERQRRVAWEAEMIAQADVDVADGGVVGSAEIRAWIKSIGTGCELLVPYAGR